jgi:hypothetical protein
MNAAPQSATPEERNQQPKLARTGRPDALSEADLRRIAAGGWFKKWEKSLGNKPQGL